MSQGSPSILCSVRATVQRQCSTLLYNNQRAHRRIVTTVFLLHLNFIDDLIHHAFLHSFDGHISDVHLFAAFEHLRVRSGTNLLIDVVLVHLPSVVIASTAVAVYPLPPPPAPSSPCGSVVLTSGDPTGSSSNACKLFDATPHVVR